MEEVLQEIKQIHNEVKEINGRFEEADQRFEKIDRRFDKMGERFDGIDKRLDGMDARFEKVEGEIVGLKPGLGSVQASLDAHVQEIRQDLTVQRDITTDMDLTDMDLRMAEGFSDLKAGQAQLQAGIDKLRRDLFLEGGLRETADDAIHTAETERYGELAKRVLVLEERMGIAA